MPVFPVDGPETDMLKDGVFPCEPALYRASEDLFEMQFLPLIGEIFDLIRMVLFFPVDDRNKGVRII